MTRSQFQEGPATNHYHIGLGVDDEVPSGGGDVPEGTIAFGGPDGLTGDEDLTWDGETRELGLVAATNGTATIKAIGAGTQMFIEAANGDAIQLTSTGGEMTIRSGHAGSSNGDGGALTIRSGDGADGSSSGPVVIQTGASTAAGGKSDDLDLKTGDADDDTGDVNIQAGFAAHGNAGWVNLAGGFTTDGTAGGVSIFSGDNAFGLNVDLTGIQLLGLPTSDPNQAGYLWIDVAAGRVLKVSAG